MNRKYYEVYSLLRYECLAYVVHVRWLLLIPLLLVITWVELRSIEQLPTLFGGNIWDAIFGVFTRGNNVLLLLSPILLYFYLPIGRRYETLEAVLIRLNSRGVWWATRIVLVASIAVGFISLSVLIVTTYAALNLPIQSGWSEIAGSLTPPGSLFKNTEDLNPLKSFVELCSLLFLGWFTMGLLFLVLSNAIRWIGSVLPPAILLFLMVVSYIIYKNPIPPPWLLLAPHIHILYWAHDFNNAKIGLLPIWGSIAFWAFWISLFSLILWEQTEKRDFVSR